MLIPQDKIELIRDRANIVDVVKRYVPSLVQKGRNYLGLCPFHKEKTPSFTVSPEKQIFYCFGCHSGGNVFSFISQAEKLSFPESVRHLAGILGIEIREEQKEETGRRDLLLRMNDAAMALYHNYLKSGPGKRGLDYITSRGVKEESIEEFRLGFAPESWDFLAGSLLKAKIDLSAAAGLGLLGVSEKTGTKRYYDRFRNRIIFPIFDRGGRPLAFGGRIIGDGEPKYLNSPESEVFKKREVLYGFNLAREHMAAYKRVIVVEGYLDVIGCHQSGIKNVVAPMGTAITPVQIQALSRICEEIVFLFDSDSAGVKASIRSLDLVDELNVQARIGMLPEGDPFEFAVNRGARELMSVVDSASKPVDFKIQTVLDNLDNIGMVNTLVQLFSVVRDLKFEVERSNYLKVISGRLGLDENDVRRDYQNFINRLTHVMPVKSKQPEDKKKPDFMIRSYRELIKLISNNPELIEKAVIDYSEKDINDDLSRNIFKKMTELYYSDDSFSIDKLFDFFTDGIEKDFLVQAVSSNNSIQNPNNVYTEIYINMKLHEIDDKIEKYADLVRSSDKGDFHGYIAEIEVLRREKEKLSQYIYNRFSE
ncbi:MAG: DNA primase [Spirochaetes bacterium]|nr:DNA primase [Spirochaetota bacterium]